MILVVAAAAAAAVESQVQRVAGSEWQTETVVVQERQQRQLGGSLAVVSEVQASTVCFQRTQRRSMDCYFLQSLAEVLLLHWVLYDPFTGERRGSIR